MKRSLLIHSRERGSCLITSCTGNGKCMTLPSSPNCSPELLETDKSLKLCTSSEVKEANSTVMLLDHYPLPTMATIVSCEGQWLVGILRT